MNDRSVPDKARRGDIAAFLRKVETMPAVRAGAGRRGRLLFAIDATASRQPTWDRACFLTGAMFDATRGLGGLSMSLCYYRGYGEFAATPWLSDTDDLTRRMTGVSCLGGQTQIARVLRHAVAETRKERVNALVFVGDAVEEDIDALAHIAGELGMLGCPGFFFHEGGEPMAGRTFRELLTAVAVYAAGGREALAKLPSARAGAAALLTHQLPGRR